MGALLNTNIIPFFVFVVIVQQKLKMFFFHTFFLVDFLSQVRGYQLINQIQSEDPLLLSMLFNTFAAYVNIGGNFR